jgi:hypothetical protein
MFAPALVAQSTALPLKHAPRPTGAAITQEDLKTRLYLFADDSMMGRQVGREGNMKGTAYIAREVQRLGLEPAGDNGTFFQSLPYVQHHFTSGTVFTVNGKALRWETDYVVTPTAVPPRAVVAVQAIYGGVAGDTAQQITAAQAAGKFVVLKPAPPGAGRGGAAGRGGGGGGGRGGFAPPVNRFAAAAAVATIELDALSPSARALINNPQGSLVSAGGGGGRGGGRGGRGGRGGDSLSSTVPRTTFDSAVAAAATPPAANLRVTTAAAAQIFGRSVDALIPGATGGTVTVLFAFEDKPVPQFARNVVAILRGSDSTLRGQFVAIGAHNDHVGFSAAPVDHDSLYAINHQRLKLTMRGTDSIVALTPDQAASLVVNVDSLRRLRPGRKDSIRNGADDDGSGSMAVLEIAEALVRAPQKPKRSIIFVWHTGEEGGLTGSRYFTDHPTVPRDSIVAQINIDMIGRGRAEDIPGGGEDYLGVVGARRLSTDLGDMVTSVNGKQTKPLKLDYRFDEDVTRTLGQAYNNIYGRSDHANYARYNIPIAFFFTGLHADYHQVTDEPQYIDYPHYARITNYIRELLVEVDNTARRPQVDKPVPAVP